MSGTVDPLKKSKARIVCCVPGCQSRPNKDNITFHYFPKPDKRVVVVKNHFGKSEKIDHFQAWKRVVKLKEISPYSKVCELHFTRDDYILPDLKVEKKRLKKNAIPSCHLPNQNEKKINCGKIPELCLLKRNLRKVDTATSPETNTPERAIEEDEPIIKDEPIKEDELMSFTEVLVKCDVAVQVDTDLSKLNFVSFITSDSELSTLTGIESFQILKTIVSIVTDTFGHKMEHHNTKMSIYDKVVLTYVKLKQNLSYSCLAMLFQCYDATHCRNVFYDMITILSACLKDFIQWPSRDVISRNLPKFFEGFEDTRVVLDCTEILTQYSKNLCCQLITHSTCKKSQTIKFMTGVTPAGNISYVSRAYGGRASDRVIFEKSDIVNLLEREDGVMVDRGFAIDEICAKNGWKCHRPPFLREKKQFSNEDALFTCKIAKARVHIERSNQKIKMFKIVGEKLSCKLIPHIEHIFTVICATINLSSPIIKDDKFMYN